MAVTIRAATADDAPAVLEMAAHFLESTIYGSMIRYNPGALETLLLLVLQVGVVYLAEVDGFRGPQGMIALVGVPNPMSGDPHAEELCWWVEPPARRTRAAHYLLRSAKIWTQQAGLSVLKMVAPAGSTVGDFYQRQGFAAFETAYVLRVDPIVVTTN